MIDIDTLNEISRFEFLFSTSSFLNAFQPIFQYLSLTEETSAAEAIVI